MTLPHPELYPFAGKYLNSHSGRMHFLDEGEGEPVVMLHGNPTWSFYFRNLMLSLRDHYRCIVPDHIGCGLSDKPGLDRYDFSLQSRIDDVERLLDSLNVRSKITLVVQDWGGMIGMGYATRHPDRIARIIATNTGCTRLPSTKPLPLTLKIGRNTKLGEWLILKRNAFCRAAVKWCTTRIKLSPEVKAMYLAPYDSSAHRLAVLKFVQTIPLAPNDAGYDLIVKIEQSLSQLSHVPTLLLWGMKDFVFDQHFLSEWQKHFPQAETQTWPDCGHYLLEDAKDETTEQINDFLAKHPLS